MNYSKLSVMATSHIMMWSICVAISGLAIDASPGPPAWLVKRAEELLDSDQCMTFQDHTVALDIVVKEVGTWMGSVSRTLNSVEFFSGAGGFTSAMRRMGLNAEAYDRLVCCLSMFTYDMTLLFFRNCL